MEKISHNGGFSTRTDFRLESGEQVRIEVWLITEYTNSNRGTYYTCNLSTKGKGCRNWVYKFTSNESKDKRIFEYLTEQQLYTAYNNHWSKLNPVRIFANGCINGEFVEFTVKEKPQQLRHFAY